MTLRARDGELANKNNLHWNLVHFIPDVGWSMRSAFYLSLD